MTEVFRDMLTAGFHGSVIIGALLLLRPLLKKSGKGLWCLLWLLAFLRLCMPFEIVSPASIQPDPIDWQEIRQLIAERRQEVQAEGDAYLPDAATPRLDPGKPSDPVKAPEAAPTVSGWIPRLWLTVAAGLILYALIAYGRLKWQVREAVRVSPGVWESGRIGTAFILGFVCPRIYLPTGLSQENRQYILAHERAHLRRWDHVYKLFAFLILSVHWFNPLVWVAYRLLCKDIEMACDQRVVREMPLEQRKAYSLALLDCSVSHTPFAACPVAFGEISVKERVKSVMRYRKPSFWLSLAGAAAGLFVAVCLFTSPKPEEAPDAPSVPTSGQTEAATVSPTETVAGVRQTVNILLVGVKDSTDLSLPDTMLLLTVDRETGDTGIVSFLPELYVDLPDLWGHKTGSNQMTAAYALGFAWQGASGAREMLGTLLREQFGVIVDYTMEIDQNTVKTIVDGLGSVDIALTQQEAEALAMSAEGVTHLDGEAALNYMELTLTGETGSAHRAERQRALLGGVLDALTRADTAQRQELVTQLLPTVLTDVTSETLLSLAELPLQKPAQSLQIPAEGTYQEKDVELYDNVTHVLIPNLPANQTLLQDLGMEGK